MPSYSLTICLTLLCGTGVGFTLSHFPVLGDGIGLYVSRNCSGGGNMMYLLTLFRRIGLGFTLSHFPVLGGGVGIFRWLINNLINCPLVSFLRSFFSISILYGFVFKPLLGRVALSISIPYGFVFKPL